MKISKPVYPEKLVVMKMDNLQVRYSMNDLAHYKRKHHKKYNYLPEGILDVIEIDYPGKYLLMLQDRSRLTTLFSNEEWIDILTKSRNSYRCHIQRMNLTRKLDQVNQVEIG